MAFALTGCVPEGDLDPVATARSAVLVGSPEVLVDRAPPTTSQGYVVRSTSIASRADQVVLGFSCQSTVEAWCGTVFDPNLSRVINSPPPTSSWIVAGNVTASVDDVGHVLAFDELNNPNVDLTSAVIRPNGTRTSMLVRRLSPARGTIVSTMAMAWNGTHHVLAFTDNTLTGDLYAIRLTRAGAPYDATPLRMQTGYGPPLAAASLALPGGVSLFAWQNRTSRDLRYARVDASGALLDPATRAAVSAARDRTSPSLSWDGVNALLVWSETSGRRAVRIAPSGVLLDATPIEISAAGGPVAASGDGSGHRVTWADGSTLFGQRLSSAGALLGAPVSVALPGTIQEVVQTSPGARPLVVARVVSGGTSVYYVTRFDAAGGFETPAPLHASAPLENRFTSDFDGTDFALAWSLQGTRAGRYARIGVDGAVRAVGDVAPDAIGLLASAVPGEHLAFPSVSSTSARYDRNFNLLGRMSPGVSSNNLVAGPNAYLIADDVGITAPYSSRARLLDVTGSPISPWATIPANVMNSPVRVAASRRGYLVSWFQLASPGAELRFQRIAADGTLVVPAAVSGIPYNDSMYQALASDGTNYLLVANGASSLLFQRIREDGALLDATPVAFGGSRGNPRVVFDGATYVIGWSTRTSLPGGGVRATYHLARVSAAGGVLDPTPVTVATRDLAASETFESGLTLATDGVGHTLVAWWLGRLYARVYTAEGVTFDAGTARDAATDVPSDLAFDRGTPVVSDVMSDTTMDARLDAMPDVFVSLDASEGQDAVQGDTGSAPDVVARPDVAPTTDAPPADRVAPREDAGVVDDVAFDDVVAPADTSTPADAAPPPPPEDAGCAVVPGTRSPGSRTAWYLGLFALVFARRRRQASRAEAALGG